MTESDAARAWSEHSEIYDSLFAPLTGFIALGLFRTAELKLPSGARCLDIACGTGALALHAHAWAKRHGGHITATDFSQQMVRGARSALERAGGTPQTFTTQVEDGQRLSFADATFDGVFSCFGIFLFADRLAGWREAARVLKPGGVFATTVWQGPATNPMLREQMKPMMEAMPERMRPPPGSPPPPGSWMEIGDAAALRGELERLDAFDQIEIRPLRTTFVLGDREASWRATETNPVMGGMLRQCSTDERAAIKARMQAHLRELAGADDAPIYLEAVCNVVTARRR